MTSFRDANDAGTDSCKHVYTQNYFFINVNNWWKVVVASCIFHFIYGHTVYICR